MDCIIYISPVFSPENCNIGKDSDNANFWISHAAEFHSMMLNSIISWIVNKLWEGHWYWWSEHTEFNRARYRSGSHFLSSQINPFFETGYIFRGRVLVFFCLLLYYSWLFDKEPKLCWLVTIVCEQTNKNRFFQSRNTY